MCFSTAPSASLFEKRIFFSLSNSTVSGSRGLKRERWHLWSMCRIFIWLLACMYPPLGGGASWCTHSSFISGEAPPNLYLDFTQHASQGCSYWLQLQSTICAFRPKLMKGLHNPLIIPIACETFSTTSFPSPQLSINIIGSITFERPTTLAMSLFVFHIVLW